MWPAICHKNRTTGGDLFCRHKALPAELNPQQNVLSTSSHQSELFPNLSPHLFTSSITLAAPGCSRKQNKHLPWGQRTSETTPQILLLEPATQKILISAATSGLQHEEVIGTPPPLPLSCSSKTGKANPLGSPHLLRTSTTVPSPLYVEEHNRVTAKLWFSLGLTLLIETYLDANIQQAHKLQIINSPKTFTSTASHSASEVLLH